MGFAGDEHGPGEAGGDGVNGGDVLGFVPDSAGGEDEIFFWGGGEIGGVAAVVDNAGVGEVAVISNQRGEHCFGGGDDQVGGGEAFADVLAVVVP
jgi:hypothetical protein